MNILDAFLGWLEPERKVLPREPMAIKKEHFFWAFRNLPLKLANRHFMVVGSTGSGKTTVIRLLLKSILPRIGEPGSANKRALVYDNKREYVSIIHSLGTTADVIIFNPFDARCHAWDISADVTNARHANSIASIIIPEEQSSQPFFADAARAILASVMVAYAKLKERDGKSWSLRDVIVTLRSAERIRLLVKEFPAVEEMIVAYLDDVDVIRSIISTIATKIAPFEVVAALWDQAMKEGRVMSLSKWIQSESILVIGSSPANRASLDPINRALFKRLFDLLLDMKNSSDSLTWMVLDEVREAGKLEGLSSLLNQGRSKGVAVVLGFQETEGMVDAYGENMAGEIFGQCGHKTFLRTGSPTTAGWIQQYFGETELMEVSFSSGVTSGAQGSSISQGVSYSKQIRPAVLASTVMQFPPTGERSGVLAALHDIPGKGVIQRTEAWGEVWGLIKDDEARRSSADPTKGDECPWPDKRIDFELVRKWGEEDEFRITGKRKESGKKEGEKREPETEEAQAVQSNGELNLDPNTPSSGVTGGGEEKEQKKTISNKLSRDRFL